MAAAAGFPRGVFGLRVGRPALPPCTWICCADDELLTRVHARELPAELYGIYSAEEWNKWRQRVDEELQQELWACGGAAFFVSFPLLGQ
jgi:hypothetical protein